MPYGGPAEDCNIRSDLFNVHIRANGVHLQTSSGFLRYLDAKPESLPSSGTIWPSLSLSELPHAPTTWPSNLSSSPTSHSPSMPHALNTWTGPALYPSAFRFEINITKHKKIKSWPHFFGWGPLSHSVYLLQMILKFWSDALIYLAFVCLFALLLLIILHCLGSGPLADLC